ncbi:hypothetical protein UY286_20585 [Paenibacillus polymyxa]|uniref:hypothetical protein n=1 Tax=Paenibacillus TaxID=44249 RepID=UPI0013ECA717|nr:MULTISPECIES: hypothetical protein [Paenibacillus]KAF6579789.1 hypothetical protein G9G54_06260 [Paenibacillus sp. EKM212P]MDY7991049.1 hypothetical protein [Paenibacillus polymyxa]MDY8119839.1 hypothetical protein [Paenibacillus polymyxa]URJ51851.3 hypothetical protein MF626_001302 [Paenibacillus polymyxa]
MDSHLKPCVTILGSGNSLGVYMPAVQLGIYLERSGISNEVCVLENVYVDGLKNKVPAYRKAFHDNFAIARKSVELARDISDCLDPTKVQLLLEDWSRERRTSFIALTGFWIPILEQYERFVGTRLEVDMLHLDATLSPSYLVYGSRSERYNHIWFYEPTKKRFELQLPMTDEAPIPFRQREERMVVHGGGWGIGTYPQAVRDLLEGGMELDVLAYFDEDIQPDPRICYYRNDPSWSPWLRNRRGEFGFPPFAQIQHGETPIYLDSGTTPLLFERIRRCTAIVSKPGGYSLMESFAAATPMVFLEPFGRHETANAEYWIKQGFGVSFTDWKTQGFNIEILERAHCNLLHARERCKTYGGVNYATQNESKV